MIEPLTKPSNEPRTLVLRPGQGIEVETTGPQPDYLHCLSGSAHLALFDMGVGWSMAAGDGCLLRTPMRYRVVARTRVRLRLELTDRSKFNTTEIEEAE